MELYEILFEEIGLDGNQRGHNAKKFACPGCGKKRFVRYVHKKTGEYLPDIYGRCDREHGCAYLLSPYDDIKAAKQAHRENNPNYTPPERTYVAPTVQMVERKLCSRDTMQQTFGAFHIQPLYRWFVGKFGKYTTDDVFSMYNVGTAKDGSTLFWQVDKELQVRTCQKIIYKGYNRDKDSEFGTQRLFKVKDDYEPCFFGEHLLHVCKAKQIDPIVCIVESEKTALIASLYLPTIPTKAGERVAVWLSCSGSNGLTDAKISVLKGYDVALFPDYSYLNRAQWGMVPMHKSPREFTIAPGKTVTRRVADQNGELDELYVNAKERIITIGKARKCLVIETDAHRIDGGDIADYLVESGLPVVVPEEPDYGSLYVMVVQSEHITTEGEIAPPVYINPNEPQPGQHGYDRATLDKMVFKNPVLGTLITTLGLQVDIKS